MMHTKVAIIGSGPSGYTAGIYAGRADLSPTLFAGEKSGGQLMNTTIVENYPGFAEGKDGPELMMAMRAQAERFGTQIRDVFVTGVDFSVRPFKLWTALPPDVDARTFESDRTPAEIAAFRQRVISMPAEVEAESVILSLGATSKMLGVEGEDTFLGRGVSTCAVCDAAFFRDKATVVVGAGDTACEDTLALTKFAKSILLLVRSDKMRASKVMQERVKNHPKVTIRYWSTLQSIRGQGVVREIVVRNTQDNSLETLPIDGVFVAIGHSPMTQIVSDQLQLDSHRFIVTRQSPTAEGVAMATAAQSPEGLVRFPTMTSVEGVFAAGDCVDPRYWQAVTAASQGCMAAIDAERWLEAR